MITTLDFVFSLSSYGVERWVGFLLDFLTNYLVGDTYLGTFITSLQSLPPIVMSLCMFGIAYGSVLLFGTLAGKNGLYAIIILLIITANIQVLKVTQFSFFNNPVAMGTELFAATYLATDILAEIYGIKAARMGVLLGFMGMAFWAVVVIFTLGFAPVSPEQVNNDSFLLSIQGHMEALLTPIPIFLVASLVSFLISQLLDVSLFSFIKRKTNARFLWLRNNVSTLISALVDSTLFSILAFMILSAHPLPIKTVLLTYILGTYSFRVVAALLDTPIMYLAKRIMYVPHSN